jgi:periplasmic protein TonB
MPEMDDTGTRWMRSRVARTSSRQSRTGRFLLLSLLLHLLAVVALNMSLLLHDAPPPPAQPRDPIEVTFARPEPAPEPEKPEALAETSSRAQSPDGPKAEVAQSPKTVLPKVPEAPSEPAPPMPASPPASRAGARPAEVQPPVQVAPEPAPEPPAKASPEPRQEKAKTPDQEQPKPQRPPAEQPESKRVAKVPEPKPTPAERPEPKRMAKLPDPKPAPPERLEPKPSGKPPTAANVAPAKPEEEAAPSSPGLPESLAQPGRGRSPFLGRIPLLSGDDLEKYAQARSGDQRASAGDSVSLDTKEVKYMSYFAHIKRRIERVWTYPSDAISSGIQGQLHLKFVLARNGQVKSVELLRSSGFKVLDKEAWDAVVNGAPFGPFPPTIVDEELHITARFSYVLDEAMRRTRMR